jgi:hypothetical protein
LWLTGIIIFLPFQHNVTQVAKLFSKILSIFSNNLDELTIVFFIPLAAIEFYKNKAIINRPLVLLFISVSSVGLYGIISGFVNHNPYLATVHGSIDYIKYFLLIFIYAAFFGASDDFKKVFRILIVTSVLIGVAAFSQEVWAVFSRYILKIDIEDIYYLDIFNLIKKETQSYSNAITWRLGMYRVASFMLNHTYLGLYCLLIFNVYSFFEKRGKFVVFFSLLSGIIGSLSRIVFVNFLLVAGLHTIRGRRWLLLFFIPTILFLVQFSFNNKPNLHVQVKSIETERSPRNSEAVTGVEGGIDSFYRKHTREKAIEIWKDHIIWGAGPSTYGSALSIKYNSPLYDYETYKIMPYVVVLLREWGTIDQFWPQVLAELGSIGIILFLWIFISLIMMLLSFQERAPFPEMKRVYAAFIVNIIVILAYSTVQTLNLTPILFTYFALVGIASGHIIRLHRKSQISDTPRPVAVDN